MSEAGTLKPGKANDGDPVAPQGHAAPAEQWSEDEYAPSSPWVLRVILAGFALMAIAAGFLWWRFGPAIFVELATTVTSCL